MAKQATVRVSAYLTQEEYEALRLEAFQRRSKITALIREAIDLWLEGARGEKK